MKNSIKSSINWDKISDSDLDLVAEIIDRTVDIIRQDNSIAPLDVFNASMSLQACAIKGGVNLIKLSETDEVTLLHDVLGITFYIDSLTGKLTNCFIPRCS